MKKLILGLLLLSMPAWGIVSFNKQFVSAQSMGASFQSVGVEVSEIDLLSIQAVWSGGGSPNGTFTLEVSNDDVAATDPGSVVNWSTYSGSSIAISDDGDLAYNVANMGYKWVRLAYARTSGTGTLDARILVKKK